MTSKTQKVLNQINGSTVQKQAVIATDMFIPNHSGVSDKKIRRDNEVRHTKWFGSIQAAIDDLPSTGGTVFIDAGTYTITTPILIEKSNVNIEGEGENSIIFLANGSNCNVITAQNSITGLRLYNFKINANGTNQTAVSRGVELISITNFYIDRLIIEAAYESGIRIKTSSYGTVTNCRIYDNVCDGTDDKHSWGIWLSITATYNLISNNTIYDNGFIGIGIGDYTTGSSYGNVITNNVILNTGDNNIDMNGAYNNVVSNNNLSNAGTNNIALDKAHDNLIIGNSCQGAENSNIAVASNDNTIAINNLFIGNKINGGDYRGIHIYDPDNILIGNYVYNTADDEIHIRATASNTICLLNKATINDNGVSTIKGASGTFTTADAKTVTVTDGIITSIV